MFLMKNMYHIYEKKLLLIGFHIYNIFKTKNKLLSLQKYNDLHLIFLFYIDEIFHSLLFHYCKT